MGLIRRLASEERGTAAAETAMVTPLLLILMFGALETGNFFLDEHVVVKAVRDGARYAARQKFGSMPCDGTAADEEAIKNQVRFGTPAVADGDQPLLRYWTSNDTITVTIQCADNSADATTGERPFAGVYTARDDVPYVTVSAVVPYSPLARLIGLDFDALSVTASNQAPVVGI